MASDESAVLFDQPGPKTRKTIRIVNWIAGIVFAIVVVLILMRLHNPPDGENQLSWELWKPALDAEAWTDFYLPGLWATIRASVLAVIGAVLFGLIFGIGRLLPNIVIRAVSGAIVEFARAVPVLLLMIFFWRWFAFAGMSSPAYWAVVLALVIYNGSVVAELVRSGVGNLPNGQREASLALGLTRTQSLMEIEVPQAIYAMLPAAVTQLVVVLKDTALGSIIMYTDLLQESRRLGVARLGLDPHAVADGNRSATGHLRHASCRRDAVGGGTEGYRSRLDHHVHRFAAGIASTWFDVLQYSADIGCGCRHLLHRMLAAEPSCGMAAGTHAEAHCGTCRTGTGRSDRHYGSVEREPDRRG